MGYDADFKRQAKNPLSYELLYRSVWWKLNENYILDVQYPQVLYATDGKFASCNIVSNSRGYKQTISIDGESSYTQSRINRPFNNADSLAANIVVELSYGEHSIESNLYNTNDIIIQNSINNVSVKEPPVSIDRQQMWSTDTNGIQLRLYHDVNSTRENLIFDEITVEYVKKDTIGIETIIWLNTYTSTSSEIINDSIELRPTESCIIRIKITGAASPNGITLEYPVRVDENYVNVKPLQSDACNLIRLEQSQNGIWQIIGEYGFSSVFQVIESSSDTIYFKTDQPTDGIASKNPLPDTDDPGNYRLSLDGSGNWIRGQYILENPNQFTWIFPYGNGQTYNIYFFTKHDGINDFVQPISIISIDPDNPQDAIADIHYASSYDAQGILTVSLESNTPDQCGRSKTTGNKVSISWGDGQFTGPIPLINDANNTFLPVPSRRYRYSISGQYLVTITVDGAYNTRQEISFFTKRFSPIYTVRIDESRLYNGIDEKSLEYPNDSEYVNAAASPPITVTQTIIDNQGNTSVSEVVNLEELDSVYPFASIDPVLMDGTRIMGYLDRNDWTKMEDGRALTSDELASNVMIEIPPFFYKIDRHSDNTNIIDVSICGDKPDNTWTTVFPESDKCIYISAFLNGQDGISVQGSQISITKIVNDNIFNRGDSYEHIDYNIITAIQSLFLLRYRVLDSTSISTGDNPQIAENQFNIIGGGMWGGDTHVRFLGLDNLWGFRPTIIGGIEVDNGEISLSGSTLPVVNNTEINRPIISKVVGNNTFGFFPTLTEGYPNERYHDVAKFNGDKYLFSGIATHLATSMDNIDYDDNGIFAIGNRTIVKNNTFKEYFVERFMVKRSLSSQIITPGITVGRIKHTPLKCVYIDNATNREYSVTIEGGRAYQYIMTDSLEGPIYDGGPSNPVRFDAKSNQLVLTRRYDRPQLKTDTSPLDVSVYALDKMMNVGYTYKAPIWVRSLDQDIDIGPDTFLLDDPVIVDASILANHPDGPFAISITVDWNIPGIEPETRKLHEHPDGWIFKNIYRKYEEEIFGQTSISIKVTVDGGEYSNGGEYTKDISLSDLAVWYNFPSVAGYCESLNSDGTISHDGFEMIADFSESRAQYIMFYSDHEVTLDEITKQDWLYHNSIPVEIENTGWTRRTEKIYSQIADDFIKLDGPVHHIATDQSTGEIISVDQRVVNQGDFYISYFYEKPGVYYPRFVLWGNEVSIESTMRITVLGANDILPEANFTVLRSEDSYDTLIIEPGTNSRDIYPSRVKIDWGDGTVVEFNPSYSSMYLVATSTEVKMVFTEEKPVDTIQQISGTFTIRTSSDGSIFDEQSHDYTFQWDGMESFVTWINENFTNVRAFLPQTGQYLIDGSHEILSNSSIMLRNVVTGESTIEVSVVWNNIPDTVAYKEFNFDRLRIITTQKGNAGVQSREVSYPPQHTYRWAGIFDVTYTAYGSYGLEDTKGFSFNSYPMYGVAVHDVSSNAYLRDAITTRMFDSVPGGIELAETQWDQKWPFNSIRMVTFNPKLYNGSIDDCVVKEINPTNIYRDVNDNNITDDVTGAYFDNAKQECKRIRIDNEIARMTTDELGERIRQKMCIDSTLAEDQARELALEDINRDAIKIVNEDLSTLCISDTDLFRGDIMVEVPNMYFNMKRAKFGMFDGQYPLIPHKSYIHNVTNLPRQDVTDCLIVEICDRKMEGNWGSTSQYQGITRKRSFISAYHGSFEDSWGGMRSLAMKMYWRESFDGIKRETINNNYDMMTWRHGTFLQLLFMLRYNTMNLGDHYGQTVGQWGDFGFLNQNSGGLFPQQDSELGTYKFCGILEPASRTLGSWIDGLRLSDRHYIYKDNPDLISDDDECFSRNPIDPCIIDRNDCDITPIRSPIGLNAIPPIDEDNGNVLAWEVSLEDNPRASINSSYFLPRHYWDNQLKGWMLRSMSYVGNNDWAFFPTADVLEGSNVNVSKYFKWGTSTPNDLFSGFNSVGRGGTTETDTSLANQGEYALFTYNKTEELGDSNFNYRNFKFIVNPQFGWFDATTPLDCEFKIEIPIGEDYFLDTDTITFVFTDTDLLQGITKQQAIDGIVHPYTIPGRYQTQAIIIDKFGTVANSGNMDQYTVPVEVYGINVQLTQDKITENGIVKYTAFEGEIVNLYCQMSYGHRISFDPGDGSYTDDPTNINYSKFHRSADFTYDNPTIDWIFNHQYDTYGEYTAKITVYVDDPVHGNSEKSEEITMSIIGLFADISMRVPDENFKLTDEWPDAESIAVQTPVQFLMNNCIGKYVRFHPEGVDGTSILLEKPYERFWTYSTLGERIPTVRVSGNNNFNGVEGVDFISASLPSSIRGVSAQAEINIYADPPVANIVDVPLGGPHWNTRAVQFDVSGSKSYKQLYVTATNTETGRIYEILNTTESIQTFEYLLPVGIYTITATAYGFYEEDPSINTITVTVTLNQIHLQAAIGDFPPSITTPIEITSMVPTPVKFKCPQTTSDTVVMNYGYDLDTDIPARQVIKRDGTVAGDGIVADGPDFEHTYNYNLPGTYYPWANIIIDEEGTTITNPESITIDVQVPSIGIVTFPNGGYVPMEVEIMVQGSNASKLTFDFDITDIDLGTESIYEVVDIQDTVIQKHTYTKPGIYTMRVFTGDNTLPYDMSIDSIPITFTAINNNPNQDFENFPPVFITVDKSTSRGEWIELIPGDYRTYNFRSPSTDQIGRRAEVRSLYNQGIKLVILEKDGVDTDYCMIYYRNTTENTVTGRPWIFNIRYDNIGQFEYTTVVYPLVPFYDYLDDIDTII